MFNYLIESAIVEPCPLGGYMANITLDCDLTFTAYGKTKKDAMEELLDSLYELGDETLC